MRLSAALVLAGCGGEIKVLPSPDTSDSSDTSDSANAGFALLSLNLHCLKLDGTDHASQDDRFTAIAALVAAEDVAVITAAELCDDGESRAQDLLELALEAATGQGWSQSSAVAHMAWEGTADEAEESLGLFVRGELSNPGSITYAVQGGLTRVAAYATLPEELGSLTVWSVHLEVSDSTSRAAQARETAGAVLTLADPSTDALVAGDLNDVEGSDAHGALVAAGFRDLSVGLGADRIDHVFAHRGASVVATAARLAFDGTAEPAVSDHPGVLVLLEPAEPEPVVLTRVTATVDVGYGHYLALRGDTAPLSWDWGWPATALDTATWRWVSSELPDGASFAFKSLVDDETWQAGDDSSGTGGQDNTVIPGF